MPRIVTVNTQSDISASLLKTHIIAELQVASQYVCLFQHTTFGVIGDNDRNLAKEIFGAAWLTLNVLRWQMQAAEQIFDSNQIAEWEEKIREYAVFMRNQVVRMQLMLENVLANHSLSGTSIEFLKRAVFYLCALLGDATAIEKINAKFTDKNIASEVILKLALAQANMYKQPPERQKAASYFIEASESAFAVHAEKYLDEVSFEVALTLLQTAGEKLSACAKHEDLITSDVLNCLEVALQGFRAFLRKRVGDDKDLLKHIETIALYLKGLHSVAVEYARVREKIGGDRAAQYLEEEINIRTEIAECAEYLEGKIRSDLIDYVRYCNLRRMLMLPGTHVFSSESIAIKVATGLYSYRLFEAPAVKIAAVDKAKTRNQRRAEARKKRSQKLFVAKQSQPLASAEEQALLARVSDTDWAKECPWDRGFRGGYAPGWK